MQSKQLPIPSCLPLPPFHTPFSFFCVTLQSPGPGPLHSEAPLLGGGGDDDDYASNMDINSMIF